MATAEQAIDKNLPMREKVWTERDTEQKLEALRSQVIRLAQTVAAQRSVIEKLMQHQHGHDGQLLAKLDFDYGHVHSHVPMSLRLTEAG